MMENRTTYDRTSVNGTHAPGGGIDLAKIPASLRERNQWLLWRLEFRGAKPTKVPYRADGNYAKTNDPTTWTDFVSAAAVANRFTGIGFVFAAEDPFCGIDLDGCRDPATGRVADWARAIIESLNTYTEVSPSETGVKLWVAGEWTASEHTVVLENVEQIGEKQAAIEVYSERRYFAMTGWRLAGPAEPQHRQEQLDALQRSHFAAVTKPRAAPSGHPGGVKSPPGDEDRATAIEALNHLPAIRCDDYVQWLEVGMVLHSIGDDMLDVWDSWSASSKKYEAGECAAKWKTFDRTGGGLKIGSLVKWARDNGWTPRRRDGGATAASAPTTLPTGSTIVEVIVAYFESQYDPTFRMGAKIFSNRLGRLVDYKEATSGFGSELIKEIQTALDFPRGEPMAMRDAVPGKFRKWAPTAWKDLFARLTEENATEEVSEHAAEKFRRQVRELMRRPYSIGRRNKETKRMEQETRSLVHWCEIFAKPGPFRVHDGVRSLMLWSRRDEEGQLNVALNVDLFAQLHLTVLYDQRTFAELCERYDVGSRCGRTGKKCRVELSRVFIAELLNPLSDDDDDDDARVREHDASSSSSSSSLDSLLAGSNGGSNGVSGSLNESPHSEGRGRDGGSEP